MTKCCPGERGCTRCSSVLEPRHRAEFGLAERPVCDDRLEHHLEVCGRAGNGTQKNGEQPYPWDRLQPQDAMSRHRGAKRRRRYGLLGVISLLSPAYLLSVERWPFHAGPPDHYGRLSSLLELSLSQSGGLVPLHSAADFRPA